jgi:23S rRNA (adenine2503-C2)-methyltransferase
MGCKFCCTATLGFKRNLSTGEIVSQVIYPLKHFTDKNITNVVFMGMGEPLLNYENLINAISILRDDLGPSMSRRKITVSTCGIVPAIANLYRDAEVGLAVSLNAPTDEIRSKIMPINKKYPLKELVGALKKYPLPKRSRITIEYVLLKGVNDRIDDAKALLKTLAGTRMKVNLIPFNPWPGAGFEAPAAEDVLAFQNYLRAHHGGVMIRKERGKDIMAACGQLAGGKK